MEQEILEQQSEEEHNHMPTSPIHEPIPETEQVKEEDNMSYSYPKYHDELDAEAHIYAFLQTWENNHVSQRLMEAETERSNIAEFELSLEGPMTRWHAKHLLGTFATFQALQVKLLWLFY